VAPGHACPIIGITQYSSTLIFISRLKFLSLLKVMQKTRNSCLQNLEQKFFVCDIYSSERFLLIPDFVWTFSSALK
jgi:hypothetical protein